MIQNQSTLSEVRKTASRILAAAVLEIFPESQLVEGGDTSLGFYYDFIFPFTFKKEFLPMLEERMRQLVKEERPMQILEMVPHNAADFLAHHGHDIRAEAAENNNAVLVEVFKMGDFIDLCEGAQEVAYESLRAFKLQDVKVGEDYTRIFGTAFSNKQLLKEFLKKNAALPDADHREIGKDLGLVAKLEGGWAWLPKGQWLRGFILNWWKAELVKQNFHLVTTYPMERLKAHKALYKNNDLKQIAEAGYCREENQEISGLFESRPCLETTEHIFCKSSELLEAAISSLQFIVKIPKIFGFECEVFFCAASKKKGDDILLEALKASGVETNTSAQRKAEIPTIEVRVEDALGRKWTISSLKVDLQEAVIIRSSFVSLERFIALLIEQHKGEFPFWLAPEQIRVFAVNGSAAKIAEQLYQTLQKEGFRAALDCEDGKLSKRMHYALQEKVPYCIFIGEREKQANKVNIRTNRTGKEESMEVEALLNHLHAMNRKTKIEN